MEVDPFASAVIEDVLLHDDSVHGDRLGEFTTTVFGAFPRAQIPAMVAATTCKWQRREREISQVGLRPRQQTVA